LEPRDQDLAGRVGRRQRRDSGCGDAVARAFPGCAEVAALEGATPGQRDDAAEGWQVAQPVDRLTAEGQRLPGSSAVTAAQDARRRREVAVLADEQDRRRAGSGDERVDEGE